MRKHIQNTVFIGLLFITSVMFSQRRDSDTLTTGVIDVVKPYAPTISDAFKVKENPTLNDETTATKKDVKYNISSFPVASTFKPDKGKAEVVENPEPAKFLNNYATLAAGNYTTIVGELYLYKTISKTDYIGGLLSHHSSEGGIDGLVLDDNFYNSKVQLDYTTKQSKYTWAIDGGFQQQKYNWYGLPDYYASNKVLAKTLDVGPVFNNAFLESNIDFKKAIFSSAGILYRYFGDNLGSGENRFVAKTNFDIPVKEKEISTDVKFDYLGGAFDRNYATNTALNYGNFQIGLAPTYQIKDQDFTLDLGVSTVFFNDSEAGKSKFYFYPNLNLTYNLMTDFIIFYGGFKGDLIQNSYYNFSSDNPFISPTLLIAPTNQKFNFYIGFNGKFSNAIGYNITGSYKKESNKALFINNITYVNYLDVKDYTYGNSFGILYDNINTLCASGEINANINNKLKMALKAEYFSYVIASESEPWNLPEITSSLFLDYKITEDWFAGANLYYVGQRKDMVRVNNLIYGETTTKVSLDGFFDANAHVGYRFNERFSVYAKSNNITNNKYNRWQNYQVQGIQFLAGLTIKFDM